MSRIQKLEIAFTRTKSVALYCLCSSDLPIQSVISLNLTKVNIVSLHFNGFPLLVTLNLKNVTLNDDILERFCLGCSKLQEIVLRQCKGLYSPQLSSSSLKVMELDSHRSDSIVMKCPNLEKLVFYRLELGE